jgi:hypothetical protein
VTDHRYTAVEIDEMRELLRRLISARNMRATGPASASGGSSSYLPTDRLSQIELELRTHMLNGTPLGEIRMRLDEENKRIYREMAQWAIDTPPSTL